MAWKTLAVDQAVMEVVSTCPAAVLGYGNQGRAHALNLRDSGWTVIVGQRPGDGFNQALADGFSPVSLNQAARQARLVIITLPDEVAAEVYAEAVAPALSPGHTLGFAHGFNIHYGFIQPPDGVDVVLVAPKGPGSLLRSSYEQGKGLPALAAVAADHSGQAWDTALAWAAGIGAHRAGIIQTTFATETETDLFGEQVSLCGGVTALMKAAFDTLVEAGYEPEFAYLECVHELKQIVDLIYSEGLSRMRERISGTAAYGDVTRGPRLINPQTRREMQQILDEIRTGSFAREWIAECKAGKPRFKQLLDRDRDSTIEQAGEQVRDLMPWLRKPSD